MSYIQGQKVQEAKEAVESARSDLSQKRKEKRKTKEGGLLPQEGDVKKKRKRKRPRKARRWLRKGKVPCVLNQEFLFLVHKYLGSERPILFEVSAPTRLKSTRKPCAKEVPEMNYLTQQKQYLKRTTLRRLKIPLRM